MQETLVVETYAALREQVLRRVEEKRVGIANLSKGDLLSRISHTRRLGVERIGSKILLFTRSLNGVFSEVSVFEILEEILIAKLELKAFVENHYDEEALRGSEVFFTDLKLQTLEGQFEVLIKAVGTQPPAKYAQSVKDDWASY